MTPADVAQPRRRRARAPRLAAIALGIVALALAATAIADTSDIGFEGCIDHIGGADLCLQNADGLNGAFSVAVSTDGKSVYVASRDDDAIVRFNRNTTTGALTPRGCVGDNDTGSTACSQSTNGLNGAVSVAVSADGKSVYAASQGDHAIVRFNRNTTTGALTPRGCVDDNDGAADTCAQTADGLAFATSVTVSTDGKSVYAASDGNHAIARFNRNTATGALTPAGCVDDNDTGADACAQTADGLEGARSVAVSADGKSVYVASRDDDAIVRFNRNTTTGALTPRGCVDDNDTGVDACAQTADGLDFATSVTVSADGKSVYAASVLDEAIVRFNRSTVGALVPKGCVENTFVADEFCAQFASGLDGAFSVAVSADGKSVYAASGGDEFAGGDDAIVRFNRNTAGAIVPTGCVDDDESQTAACAQTADGLDFATSVTVSADGKSLYATGSGDDAVVRFARNAP